MQHVLYDQDSPFNVKKGLNTLPFEFFMGEGSYPPTTLYTSGKTYIQYHLSVQCVFDERLVKPLSPRRDGNAVVKFRIVKAGGVRVRNSSRLNSK